MFGKEGKWPYAPFHPSFEDRQHTFCPDTGFDPILLDLSGLLSPFGHCRRLFVPIPEHRASTFLRPLAPQTLPRFVATMDALTPAGPALRLSDTEHEHRPCYPTGLPASRARPLRPFRPQPPDRPRRRFLTLPLSATGFRYHPYRSGLRHSLAGSPVGPAVSGSLWLRTSRSPPVALHPASRRRSYSQLLAGECMPEEDSHLSVRTRSQAH